jgi:S-adenosylmethionine-diacylglycerol 3-amino-3-carboxypropyl transferase
MPSVLNHVVERVAFHGLVFNQSWEDPVLDIEALQIESDRDTVLTITSGGCNSLNLLCLRPRKLICVDTNPAQTYLLELKLAGIRYLEHHQFFALFGTPAESHDPVALYQRVLRQRLRDGARDYWDRNTRILEHGVLTQGKLGFFLRWLQRYLRWQVGEQRMRDLFLIDDLVEQRDYYYREIQPRMWRHPWALRMISIRPVMAMAGMHPTQYDLIRQRGGLEHYIKELVENVLTNVPVRQNYFVAQAALGAYIDHESVPPYLLAKNFEILRETVDRLVNLNTGLLPYLDSSPEAAIDKFSLLDIFDWMDHATFAATMRSVIRAGSRGGRFIYRSTAPSLPVPTTLRDLVVGEPEFARELLARDRSAVYRSLHIYRIT